MRELETTVFSIKQALAKATLAAALAATLSAQAAQASKAPAQASALQVASGHDTLVVGISDAETHLRYGQITRAALSVNARGYLTVDVDLQTPSGYADPVDLRTIYVNEFRDQPAWVVRVWTGEDEITLTYDEYETTAMDDPAQGTLDEARWETHDLQ